MANRTAKDAQSVHGANPQFLVEKIIRTRIYECKFWKEECFALTAEAIVDKAMALDHVGGVFGGNYKPSNFLCLVLKMLQIQPDKDIIIEFIKNEDFKYVRILGALYLRLVGSSIDCYQYLEPLLNDFRKLKFLGSDGKYFIKHIDEFVDDLLRLERLCDCILPRIQDRYTMELNGELEPRVSLVDENEEEDELPAPEPAPAPQEEARKPTDDHARREIKKEEDKGKEVRDSRDDREGKHDRDSRDDLRGRDADRTRSSRDDDSHRRSPRRYSHSRSRSRSPRRRSPRRSPHRRHRSHSRSRSPRRRSRSPSPRRHSRSRSRSPHREDRSSHRDERRRSRSRTPEKKSDPAPARKASPPQSKPSGRHRLRLKGEKDKPAEAAPAPTPMDEIAEANALRAKLGLKPLRP